MLNLTNSTPPKWSEEEKDILRKLYHNRNFSLDQISGMLKRTRYAVLLQAQYLGLKRPQHDHQWTKEERKYLSKNFGKKSYREIAAYLGLTHSAVSHQANRMGLKLRSKGRPLTEEEKQYIKKYYRKIPTREIARKLNRSVDSIINSAGPLGISRGMSEPWSNEDNEFLVRN